MWETLAQGGVVMIPLALGSVIGLAIVFERLVSLRRSVVLKKPVLDLIDTRDIYVSAPMDEVDSGRIRQGQAARLTVDSHPGESFLAQVVEVAPYVVDRLEQNRTVEIEVELDDPEVAATLLPGTSADAEVILSAREGVLRIPTGALLEGGKVFVLEEGRLVERTLELGLRNWDFTEVIGGLEPGSRVVVSLDRPEIEAGVRAREADPEE